MGFIISGTVVPPVASIIGVYGTNMKQVHINVDSSNNIYMNAMTGFDNRIIKLNSSGTAQWQAGKQDDMAGTLSNSGVVSGVDSSGNYYFASEAYGAGVGRVGSIVVFKYDSSGTLQWQRYIRDAGNAGISNLGFYIDSSDNLYVSGTRSGAIVLFKLNTSGTVQWGKKYSATSLVASGSLTVDSSGNVYGSGYTTATGLARPFGFKTNSSGVLQWMTSVGDGTNNIYPGQPSSTAVDSSGNLYIGIGYPTKQIVKFNSSGVVEWQRAGTAGQYLGIDTSGNIYSASNTTDSTSKIGIFKHDSSGSLQWQRTISHASTAMTVESIAVNGSGINIAGITSASGSDKVFFARLSLDGTSTGTYTVGGYSYVYAASSISSTTPTLTSSTISVTETTDAGSVGTPAGYTLQTPSLSTSVTTISSAGDAGPFGTFLGGTGTGMVISSYVPPVMIDYLMVAGGGGGGGYGASGGGAGGVVTGSTTYVAGTTYAVTVGGGGAGGGQFGVGTSGTNSTVTGLTTAIGGGGGASPFGLGLSGGSGGGGGGHANSNKGSGTAGQGFDGGRSSSNYAGGGGGGAGGVGGTGTLDNTGGAGGIGITSTISGSSVTYAGGGGGGSNYGGAGGAGGSGIGGNGGTTAAGATAGAVNTGSGGGGSGQIGNGASGGSGVVILRTPDSVAAAASTTGLAAGYPVVSGGYRIYKWTTVGSGSITF